MLSEYTAPKAMLTVLFVLLTLKLITADASTEKSASSSSRKRIVSDPLSNFLSELGDFISDEASLQTGLLEENKISPIFMSNPDYLSRIHRNTRKRQGRLAGKSLHHRDAYSEREFPRGNPAVDEMEPFTLTSAQRGIKMGYNPFVANAGEKARIQRRFSDGRDDECSNEVLTDPLLEFVRKRKCAHRAIEERIISDIKKMTRNTDQGSKITQDSKVIDHSKSFMKRQGIVTEPLALRLKSERNAYVTNNECSHTALADPLLESLRKARCARIEAEYQIDELKRLMLETNRPIVFVDPEIRSISSLHLREYDDTDESKPERDERSIEISDECSKEVHADPLLEHLRQQNCLRVAAEVQIRRIEELVLNSKRASEALVEMDSKTLERLPEDTRRLGDVDSKRENDETNSDVVNECSKEVLADPILERRRKQKCARIAAEERTRRQIKKLLMESKWENGGLARINSKPLKLLPKDIIRRHGDIFEYEDLNMKSEGRTVGDVSNFESSFDKNVRQFLKDHGRWILGNPLLAGSRQSPESRTDSTILPEIDGGTTVHGISDATTQMETEAFAPALSEHHMAFSKSGETLPEDAVSLTISDDERSDTNGIEQEVDTVIKPRLATEDEVIETEQKPRDTVILAFSSDGIPLKLRVAPEVDNPLYYLHNILNSAGVSLYVPVESYEDLEPVGKEVLKLGSGTLIRAIYIDASDNNEMKSLLKVLGLRNLEESRPKPFGIIY